MTQPANNHKQLNWAVRPYTEGDFRAFADLVNYVFQADGVPVVISDEEQRREFERPGFDPTRGALVVESELDGVEPGMLLGCGMIPSIDDPATGDRIYTASLFVHPAARQAGLQYALAKALLDIPAREQTDGTLSPATRVLLKANFSDKQDYLREAWEHEGMRLARVFWTMECPLDRLDEPPPVEGVTLRHYNLPADNPAAIEAYNQSFVDHYDFHAMTEQRWQQRMQNPLYRLDLSWVAEPRDEPGNIVGFCYCAIFEEENKAFGRRDGWIDLLGTMRGWRKMGVGRALLLNGMHSLRSAGLDTACLGVDSTSPTGANRLYESVGFHVRDSWVQYERELQME